MRNGTSLLGLAGQLHPTPAVGGTPRQNRWQRPAQVPARTPESDTLSRDLRRRANESMLRKAREGWYPGKPPLGSQPEPHGSRILVHFVLDGLPAVRHLDDYVDVLRGIVADGDRVDSHDLSYSFVTGAGVDLFSILHSWD